MSEKIQYYAVLPTTGKVVPCTRKTAYYAAKLKRHIIFIYEEDMEKWNAND